MGGSRLGQPGAQPELSQAGHRASQSTMMKLSAMLRSSFLTKTEDASKSGSLRKRKPRSSPPCPLEVGTRCWSEITWTISFQKSFFACLFSGEYMGSFPLLVELVT